MTINGVNYLFSDDVSIDVQLTEIAEIISDEFYEDRIIDGFDILLGGNYVQHNH